MPTNEIGAVAAAASAIIAIVTLVIAVWQFKTTVRNDQQVREDEHERAIKDQAYLVDAWVEAKKSGDRRIAIVNHACGPVRDISLKVNWREPGREQKTKEHIVPGPALTWRLLSSGKWAVKKKTPSELEAAPKHASFLWWFPERVSLIERGDNGNAETWDPEFTDFAGNEILALSFTDPYGNKWKRTYVDERGERVNLLERLDDPAGSPKA